MFNQAPVVTLLVGGTARAQVMEQETAFDGLQWFQSVGAHYEAEATDVAARSPSKCAPLQVPPFPSILAHGCMRAQGSPYYERLPHSGDEPGRAAPGGTSSLASCR